MHGSEVEPHEAINIEDLTCDGFSDHELRAIPSGQANSIVWLRWHMARSEDVGINIVVGGRDQILDDDWCRRMAVDDRDIGTA